MLGIRMADLSPDEVMNLRPLAYRRLAEVSGGPPLLLKIHDRWCTTPSGVPLFPPEVTSGCVHVVRDPRDVCLSLAAHNGTDIDRAIAQMADPDFHVNVGKRSGNGSGCGVPGLVVEPLRELARHPRCVGSPCGMRISSRRPCKG